MSPKLRALRAGLDALGLDSGVFLRHHAPRLLYAASLVHNTRDVLLGLAEPDYVLKPPDGSDGVREIARYWCERWLHPRLQRPDTWERLRTMKAEQTLVGREIRAQVTRGARPPPPGPPMCQTPAASAFVERLYRNTNSYADRLAPEDLALIDVDLGLNSYLLEAARAGFQIVLTGNPGDGKTHLIERLRPELEAVGALVLTDANVHSDDRLLADWRACAAEERPFVLAINEWPLFVLHRHAAGRGFAPLGETMRQVRQASYYAGDPPAAPSLPVRVIDLGLRNVLSAPVIQAVVERLIQPRFYQGLDAKDPAVVNRDAVRERRVQERLCALLDRVARHGYHATMRQLVGYVAYLLTAGSSAVERLSQPGSFRYHYANLAFEERGCGPLFDAVRACFDPATTTHPRHDMDLWRGTTVPHEWLVRGPAPVGPQQMAEASRADAFAALKRRFFFEHGGGSDLLQLWPEDEQVFDRFVTRGEAGDPGVVRDLIFAMNRFFEPDTLGSAREEVYLWQSHRYDVRAPSTFVSLHTLSHQCFRVEPLRYAGWVTAWLPAEQRMARSFALVAEAGDTAPAVLMVDRDLYLTLHEATTGLGRTTWTRSATRKLTRFIDHLHRLSQPPSSVESIRIRNTETDLEHRFEIQRAPSPGMYCDRNTGNADPADLRRGTRV